MKLFAIIIGILMIIGALIGYPYDLYKEFNSLRLVGGDAYNFIMASNIICAKYICSCLSSSFGFLLIVLSALIKKEGKKK